MAAFEEAALSLSLIVVALAAMIWERRQHLRQIDRIEAGFEDGEIM